MLEFADAVQAVIDAYRSSVAKGHFRYPRGPVAKAVDTLSIIAGDSRVIPHQPRRGSDVEQWLRRKRDEYEVAPGVRDAAEWNALDNLLDDYRLHADTGTPLDSLEPMGPTTAGMTDDA